MLVNIKRISLDFTHPTCNKYISGKYFTSTSIAQLNRLLFYNCMAVFFLKFTINKPTKRIIEVSNLTLLKKKKKYAILK